MKSPIYLIPGQGESGQEKRYQKLIIALRKKGHRVTLKTPDWYAPLTKQTFKPEKDAIIIGFSFGAVLAYLTAKKHRCQKLILASLSPLRIFSRQELEKDFMKYMDSDKAYELACDIKSITIDLKTLTTPYLTLAGDHNDVKAEILIPQTGHYMTSSYINAIVKIV